ncbi:hypothetical protein, partial [Segatella copri]|uniref:hypothetical protein n=1 Tax=Segatella copri TaxID=165179 RepID=UPI001D171912
LKVSLMAVSTVPMIIVLDCSWCKGINFSVESKKFPLDISGEPLQLPKKNNKRSVRNILGILLEEKQKG